MVFNQDFAAWLMSVQKNAYEAQRILCKQVFQTQNDGDQGSGIQHAESDTQNCQENLPTNSISQKTHVLC